MMGAVKRLFLILECFRINCALLLMGILIRAICVASVSCVAEFSLTLPLSISFIIYLYLFL